MIAAADTTVLLIAAGVAAIVSVVAALAPRLWGKRNGPVASLESSQQAPVAPVATCPLDFQVVRIHGTSVELLHPADDNTGHIPKFVTGRDARVLFENAKLGPQRGIVQVIQHGKVRGSHG